MELRGRLPPSIRFAIGRPCASVGRNEKSVSSLLSRNPAAQIRDPNAASIVVVIATALPSPSMIDTWLVPDTSIVSRRRRAGPRPFFWRAGLHALGGAERRNERPASREIGLVEKTGRNAREIRVGEIAVAVGIGELLRLRDEMHRRSD